MTSFDKLIKYFERFPGIGARQAKRFAFHILTLEEPDVVELAELIRTINTSVATCPSCYRFHSIYNDVLHCQICRNESRDRSKLTIVERDTDIDAIERSGTYNGLYFVLGGMVPLLDSHDIKKLRGGTLKHLVAERAEQDLAEIILGFSINPDGENTGRYIEMLLKDTTTKHAITITHLGRGLSTGSELEYADSETIKNAFINRS
ncbi:MAG: toprim domain-containing protein [Candidatus Pacebacteria bacterium]|nr:toprim domain-containing protein [Candidatus Paceibacterota bacterium]MCF7857125.1 toprim domain-containing protein [Candidatus Paceibacterota bacterium]